MKGTKPVGDVEDDDDDEDDDPEAGEGLRCFLATPSAS